MHIRFSSLFPETITHTHSFPSHHHPSISPLNRQHTLMLGASLVLTITLTSCGDNKIAQCNQLIEQINQTEKSLTNITQSSSPDVSALQDIASTTSQAATTLDTLKLNSKPLKGFQTRFVDFYQQVSQNSQAIVTAHGEQNMTDAEAAYQRLEETFNTQEQLVNEVNDFCGDD